MATRNSPGNKLFCLSGSVKNPGVFESPLGITLGDLIENYGKGMQGTFKAAFPGGVASQLVTDLNLRLDYQSVAQAGSSLGPGSVIVINTESSLLDTSQMILSFFAHESCGKCSVCREGTRASLSILRRVATGLASPCEKDLLFELSQVMRDSAGCLLGQSALNSVTSALTTLPG